MSTSTISELHERKSVRVFEPRPIEDEVKQQILDAAIQAPTAGNMSLFTILDITDPEMKTKLSESCDHQPFIATAPLVLIFCADYRRWYDVFCQFLPEVRKPAMGDLMLSQADTLIAAQNAVVAAHALGVGSCYIGDIIENFEYHRQLLNLPQYVVPTAMLVMGYPTQQQCTRPKPPRFATADLVHENGYDAAKAARMAEMLSERNGLSGDEFADWMRRFCKRKWNSDFSVEMSRSASQIVRSWCESEE